MAREYARIRISIAHDDDFESLSADAQWLYTRVLIPEPSLNYAGVGDWRPNRLLRKSADMTMPRLLRAASELETRRYALFDTDTEEFVVRTLIRSDELLKNPKMAAAVITGYAKTASNQLRAVLVSEIQRVHSEHPEYSSWTHKDTGESLAKLLTRPNLETVGYTNAIPVQNTDVETVKNTDRNPVDNGDTEPVQNTDMDPGPEHRSESVDIPLHLAPSTYHPAPKGGYVSTEGYLSEGDEPPPPNCPRHPGGTDAPCRACGEARERREKFDHHRAVQAKSARRNAIEACEWCDSTGWRIEPTEIRDHDVPAIRCDHTPMALDEWQSLIPTEEPSHA